MPKKIGKVALTATERQQRWRAKKRRQAIFGPNRDPSARRPTPHREDLDFWPTPRELRVAFIEKVLPTLPPDVPIWECAAGDGAFGDEIAEAGRRVITSDINPQRRGILRLDFLNEEPPAETQGSIAATNPPFGKSGLLYPFLARTMALLDAGWLRGAALLLRADAMATIGRADILNRAAAEWTCCWRQIWLPGTTGQPRWWFHWFLWLAGCSGPPVNRRVIEADLRGLI
jgi:hypothetical protein